MTYEIKYRSEDEMKECGIEWLGKVPKEWEVSRIKDTASNRYKSFVDGDWIESNFITEDGIRLIQTGNIRVGKYREQGYRYISDRTFKTLNCTEVFENDILICRLAEPVGRACLAPKMDVRMITSVDVCILKPNIFAFNKYLVYALSNQLYLDHANMIGYSGHYDTFPFSLTLSYDTTTQVLYDIIESVLRNGIERIIIINGHDGNIAPIEIASRKIKEKYSNARIAALTQWWVTAGELLPEDTFEVWDGLGHGGEGESSIMYYLYPELCQPELATSVVPDNLPPYLDLKWDFSEITDTGQTGDATKATGEKGKKMNEVLLQAMTEAIDYLNERDWNYNTTDHAATKLD